MASVSKQKDYKFQAKLYPDTCDYDCDVVLSKLIDLFSEWAYILHDKDVRHFHKPSVLPDLRNPFTSFRLYGRVPMRRRTHNVIKPHIHFYGKNNHNRQFSLSALVKYLEIPYKFSQNGDFQYVTSWDACMAYTVHYNAPEKYQYSVLEVKTNIRGFASKYLRFHHDSRDELNSVIEYIRKYSFKFHHPPAFYELATWCNNEGFSIHLSKTYLLIQYLQSYKSPDRL